MTKRQWTGAALIFVPNPGENAMGAAEARPGYPGSATTVADNGRIEEAVDDINIHARPMARRFKR
ncbi:MAG: hypothetical protein ACLQUZ_04485 [Rhizomicrobium sp.]